jgi:natural product precursor
MKKINLKGISEILSEKELKNVMGGSGSGACGSSKSCTTNSDCYGSGAGLCRLRNSSAGGSSTARCCI